mgnify:CR=1 FL=1
MKLFKLNKNILCNIICLILLIIIIVLIFTPPKEGFVKLIDYTMIKTKYTISFYIKMH